MKRCRCLLLAVLLALLPMSGLAARQEKLPGQEMEPFELICADGSTFSLAEALVENELVLISFFASWCPPCRAELPMLSQLAARYGGRVAVIALSMDLTADTDETLLALAEELEVSLPMGRDPARLARFLSVSVLPTLVAVDRYGRIVAILSGVPDGVEDYVTLIERYLGPDYPDTAVWQDGTL